MKSWDVDAALRLIEEELPDRSSPVLDMGCFNSEVVYGLHNLGYRHVFGCDLNPICRWMPFWHKIDYRAADLTRTPYPDSHFGAITCLSVVEHGVPIDPLVAEVRRLLRPGGLFLLTTDFDGTGAPHEIDPKFRVFDQSWRIFDRPALETVISQFESVGFSLLDPQALDLEHSDRPIRWNGQEYTFTLVAFRAPGNAVLERNEVPSSSSAGSS